MERDIKLGVFLKERRKNKGLSQYQLGKLLGVSDRAVSKWENGLSKPNSKLLLKISEIFCLSTDEILQANLNSDEIIQIEIAKTRNDLWKKLDSIIMDHYGLFPAIEVISRYEKEKLALMNSNILQILNMISLLSEEALKTRNKIKVMGGLGSCFVPFLLGISTINPLPPHYYCPKCKSTEFVSEVRDGWDLPHKQCECCNTVLEGDGHNIPFEVYRHVINNKAGFDILINKSFYNTAEQFIIDNLENYSLTILNNPYELYHGKIASDATTFVIQPIDKRRYVKKFASNPTINEYIENLSYHSYINLMFDDTFEKITEFGNRINLPCERINFRDEKLLNFILYSNTNDISVLNHSNFIKLLKKHTAKTFDNLIHIFGIIMLSEEYPYILETLYDDLSSIDEIIVYRDDLFNLLCSKLRDHGCYDSEIAYVIMNNARKGIYHRSRLDAATRRLLMEIGFSNDFIIFLESTQYMFCKAVGILYLEKELLLMWYRMNYPNEFIRIFQKPQEELKM